MDLLINNNEIAIKGEWIFKDNQMTADDKCKRIESLILNYLKKIGNDSSGWISIFIDPNDNRYWKKVYENSSLHGGGPPSLICISKKEADALVDVYEEVPKDS